jgi:SAM-dependent methyltransferase
MIAQNAPNAACPSCGSPHARRTGPHHEAGVYRCGRCGLGFVWPQPSGEELGRRYRELYFTDDPVYGMSDRAYLRQIVDRHIRRMVPELAGLRVLDFGCGDGQMLCLLGEAGADCVGVESSDDARRAAAGRSGAPVFGTIDEAKAHGPFDLVILNEVIEHTRLPRQVLGDLFGHIRPGGGCYVSTPNFRGLKARLLGPRWSEYVNGTHLCHFNARALRRLGAEVGFAECIRLPTRVRFAGLGPVRRAANRVLSALRIDSGLKMYLRKPHAPPTTAATR